MVCEWASVAQERLSRGCNRLQWLGVARWLPTQGLGHISHKFTENAVDGAFLQELTTEELVSELGLTQLQAKKVKLRFAAMDR